MLLASVLMVFITSVNRALMSLLASSWKPSINCQKSLFLMIVSTNSMRAAAGNIYSRPGPGNAFYLPRFFFAKDRVPVGTRSVEKKTEVNK